MRFSNFVKSEYFENRRMQVMCFNEVENVINYLLSWKVAADKWSLLILCSLQAGKLRYTEIRKAVPDISQKMLTCTLKQLERDHLLKRKAFAEIPPRVEYSLTELGQSLMPIIGQMIEWAQVHIEEVTM